MLKKNTLTFKRTEKLRKQKRRGKDITQQILLGGEEYLRST